MRIKNPMMNEKPVIPMRYDFARAGKMKGINTQSLYASGLYSDDQRNKAK